MIYGNRNVQRHFFKRTMWLHTVMLRRLGNDPKTCFTELCCNACMAWLCQEVSLLTPFITSRELPGVRSVLRRGNLHFNLFCDFALWRSSNDVEHSLTRHVIDMSTIKVSTSSASELYVVIVRSSALRYCSEHLQNEISAHL